MCPGAYGQDGKHQPKTALESVVTSLQAWDVADAFVFGWAFAGDFGTVRSRAAFLKKIPCCILLS